MSETNGSFTSGAEDLCAFRQSDCPRSELKWLSWDSKGVGEGPTKIDMARLDSKGATLRARKIGALDRCFPGWAEVSTYPIVSQNDGKPPPMQIST